MTELIKNSNFSIEYNENEKLFYNMLIKFKNNDKIVDLNFLYNKEDDTFTIKNYMLDNDNITYNNTIIFTNFENEYGKEFIDKFIKYLIIKYKLQESNTNDTELLEAVNTNNSFIFKNFKYEEMDNGSTFVITKKSFYDDGFINLYFYLDNTDDINSISYKDRLKSLISNLKEFLENINDTFDNKDNEEEIDKNDSKDIHKHEIVGGTITFEEDKLIIEYSHNNKIYSKLDLYFTLIEIDDCDEGINNTFTIYTSYDDTFEIKFYNNSTLNRFKKELEGFVYY